MLERAATDIEESREGAVTGGAAGEAPLDYRLAHGETMQTPEDRKPYLGVGTNSVSVLRDSFSSSGRSDDDELS